MRCCYRGYQERVGFGRLRKWLDKAAVQNIHAVAPVRRWVPIPSVSSTEDQTASHHDVHCLGNLGKGRTVELVRQGQERAQKCLFAQHPTIVADGRGTGRAGWNCGRRRSGNEAVGYRLCSSNAWWDHQVNGRRADVLGGGVRWLFNNAQSGTQARSSLNRPDPSGARCRSRSDLVGVDPDLANKTAPNGGNSREAVGLMLAGTEERL